MIVQAVPDQTAVYYSCTHRISALYLGKLSKWSMNEPRRICNMQKRMESYPIIISCQVIIKDAKHNDSLLQ